MEEKQRFISLATTGRFPLSDEVVAGVGLAVARVQAVTNP
jgi:hypothetical protein